MTLPSSGPLSLSQMNAEFGGGGSLSGYYAGGGHVPNPTGSVPASGAISFSEFLGTQNALQIFSLGIANDGTQFGYISPDISSLGSLSPTTASFAGGATVLLLVWLNSSNTLYFQLSGNQSGSCFTTLVINGNTYAASSGSPAYDGVNDWTLWQWSTGNPIGSGGTIPVTFH